MTSFQDLGLSPEILKGIELMGFKAPSPIQAQAIPLIKAGGDVIALAKTGSGKTATCAIPICDKVDPKNPLIQALILVPTRELCIQYATEVVKVGKVKGVSSTAVYGGGDAGMQLAKIKHGVQVLVATPGRLIDYIHRRDIDLSTVQTVILDEADEMLSLGFLDDLEFIISCITQKHQTLLLSATMSNEVRAIAKRHMINATEIALTTADVSPANIEHKAIYCSVHDRPTKLAELMAEYRPHQSIIFCGARHHAEEVARFLRTKTRDVEFLHGGLSQDLRTSLMGKFRSGKIKHLVATDVAARGVDVSAVSHVFIYEIGKEVDTYVHRAGRTGRYERQGTVVSLVTKRELWLVPKIEAKIERKLAWIGSPPPEGADSAPPARPAGKRPPAPKRADPGAVHEPRRPLRTRPHRPPEG